MLDFVKENMLVSLLAVAVLGRYLLGYIFNDKFQL